jgi:hypothetical protein
MGDFRPAEVILLQTCLVWGVIVVMIGAVIALWIRRGKG